MTVDPSPEPPRRATSARDDAREAPPCRFDGTRAAVTSAAESRWRLRQTLSSLGDPSPRVDRYLVGNDVVFQAVDRGLDMAVAPLSTWIGKIRLAFDALVRGLVDPAGRSHRALAVDPLGGFPMAASRERFEDWSRVSATGLLGDEVASLELLQPYHQGRTGNALLWMAELAAHRFRGDSIALGVHVEDVRVAPMDCVRRARATVDLVHGGRAVIGAGERVILARVRCPDAEVAARVHRELQVQLMASVEATQPSGTHDRSSAIIDRMASVEDFLYLAAARMTQRRHSPA